MNAPNQLSFLPEDYLARKAQRRTNVICAILSGIVMAAIGSAFSLTEKMSRQADAEHARVDQEYADAAREIEQVQLVEQKQRKMARQAELASSLLEKIPRSNILAEITNAVPDNVTLVEFSLISNRKSSPAPAPVQNGKNNTEPPAPEPIAYDVNLRVTGVAANDVQVAEFIRNLSQSPLFTDVNLIISDELTVENEKVRHFQVEMGLNPNPDLSHLGQHPGGNSVTSIDVPTN
ncbi:MAG: PilN domain-containing protein [Tepidisphaeraceae bacterium]|jgi:Tfp pilus assembly protein PilN